MRFPRHITTDAIAHQFRNGLKGNKRYPMVLMLEPLYTCNLACLGCALERHTGKLEDRMSLEECLRAVEESGAPIGSICGGEPTIYPELKELLEGIIERKRHIYLCTNALLLDKNLFGKVAPHKRLTINVHLDGMQKTHDLVCDRAGVFDKASTVIPGSQWRDPAHVAEWAQEQESTGPVVVYCVYGHEVGRATALRLRAAGVDARFLHGGIDGWERAGRPLGPKS